MSSHDQTASAPTAPAANGELPGLDASPGSGPAQDPGVWGVAESSPPGPLPESGPSGAAAAPAASDLAVALEAHTAGRRAQAAELYAKVLAKDGSNAVALHWLGVLYHQQGEPDRAVELIGRAVMHRPNVPAFHVNLGEAYRARGDLDRAIGCCRTALMLAPESPEGLCGLGLALQAKGRHDEAVARFRQVLALRPAMTSVHNNLGISLRELGQFDEALEHFRLAVELDPSIAQSHTNLGLLLLERGRASDAVACCREAVRLNPDVAASHHNLGLALRGSDQPTEARASFLEAIRLAPEFAAGHAQVGLTLQAEGQFADSLPWLRQAALLVPGNPVFWGFLADVHGELNEFEEAKRCAEQALATGPPGWAAPHLAMGRALQEGGQLAEAQEHYRLAADLQPESAAAHIQLGSLYEEMGELDRAEAAYREALARQPSALLARARLATLVRGDLPDPDLAAIEAGLADPGLSATPRARLLFALAHVLDARGDYARAADCLREANARSREQARGMRNYAPAEHEAFVDHLIRACDAEFFARAAGWGRESRRPVFVFGLPRSGTTLVEQVLSSHPEVHGAGEIRQGRLSFDAMPAALGVAEPPLACLRRLDASATAGLADRHLEKLLATDGGRAARVVDKTPDNYLPLGLLAVLFPQATFIHCQRDLRDVAVSCWMTDFRSIYWANDPDHIASYFRQYRRLMDHWQGTLPVPVHEVRYEDTVGDLESVARRLVAACGLEWDPACLEFHRNRRPVRTASLTQVRQPIYRRSLDRWKNYEAELADLFALLPNG